MKSVKGIYDGNQITFDEPITVPPNTRVLVTFLNTEGANERRISLEEFIDCVNYSGPPKTLEDMEEGIRLGALESTKWWR